MCYTCTPSKSDILEAIDPMRRHMMEILEQSGEWVKPGIPGRTHEDDRLADYVALYEQRIAELWRRDDEIELPDWLQDEADQAGPGPGPTKPSGYMVENWPKPSYEVFQVVR